MFKKFLSLFFMASLLFVGVAMFNPTNTYASELKSVENVENYIVNNTPPIETPYIVNVLQLGGAKQVQMRADFADSDRNITTETKKIYVGFDFISRIVTKHTYFKIVEDSNNLTIFAADMGKGGKEHTFNTTDKMFRENQSYTIYHSYGSNKWNSIGRFKVNQ